MTKEQYIKNHPKSYLAKALQKIDWPENTPVQIIGGLDAPNNPRSNLYKAIERSNKKEWVRGGHRQRGTEGWWFAVA